MAYIVKPRSIDNKFEGVRNTGLVIEKNINNKTIIIKNPYLIEKCVKVFLFIFSP